MCAYSRTCDTHALQSNFVLCFEPLELADGAPLAVSSLMLSPYCASPDFEALTILFLLALSLFSARADVLLYGSS